jgi:hypothetical protein
VRNLSAGLKFVYEMCTDASAQDTVAISCERDNEPYGSIKGRK